MSSALAIGAIVLAMGAWESQHAAAEPQSRTSVPATVRPATAIAAVQQVHAVRAAHDAIGLTDVASDPCARSALRWGAAPQISERTGDEAFTFTLTNVGATGCRVSGYPTVRFLDAEGNALPFRYSDGHSQYVTHAPPTTVSLWPGSRAYVAVAKYRCDAGDRTAVASATISLGAGGRPIAGGTGRALRSLAYCRGGSSDPGQVISISPLELTEAATIG